MITSTQTDIIFLSDLRLVTSTGVQNDERVFNAFRDSNHQSYFAHLNSKKNSRGVGILISNRINNTVLDKVLDDEENFLLLKCKVESNTFIIGAVYGPNGTDRVFFQKLSDAINQLKGDNSYPIILGGDWNTTWDSSPPTNNIDIFQMAAVPNLPNSVALSNMCSNLSLTDPYRILYPFKTDYTYTPFGTLRKNRSRLDFFLHLKLVNQFG